MARPYRSTRRAAAADRTRLAVLEAAHERFVTEGWTATTIAGIAQSAGVSAETIYAVFGSKKALVTAVVERAVRGAQDTPMMEQAGRGDLLNEPDTTRRVTLFAADITEVLGRVAPLMSVLKTAAETDPEIADLYAGLQAGRRRNLAMLADTFAAPDGAEQQPHRQEITDLLWRLASPEIYLLVTVTEGRTPQAFSNWLGKTLVAAIAALAGATSAASDLPTSRLPE